MENSGIACQQSKIALEDILDNLAEAVFLLDPEGYFRYLNRHTRLLFANQDAESLPGQHFSYIVEPAARAEAQEAFERCAKRGETVSSLRTARHGAGGSLSIISWNLSPLNMGTPDNYVVGIARDIVEDMVVDYRFTDILKNLGQHKQRRPRQVHARESSGQIVVDIISEFLFTQDRLEKDIAERKRTEAAMARVVAILEATTDLVAIADVQGRLEYLNNAGRRLMGIEELETLASQRGEQNVPYWVARLFSDEALSAAAVDGAWNGEAMIQARDGREIPMLQVVLAHKSEQGAVDYFSTIMRDISSRKQKEQELYNSHRELQAAYARLEETQHQLFQSENMASIGQLAAGVAHEINNPLGYVYSNLESLEQYIRNLLMVIQVYEDLETAVTDSGWSDKIFKVKEKADLAFLRDDIPALMDESKEGIRRIKEIVQSLREFSHIGSTDRWQWADLHEGLNSTLNIVWNELKYKADVVKEYGEIPEIECLPMQLNQVFMNLLLNAAQAIPQRGTITLRTGCRDGTVWVEITDTGDGIAPENLHRIFDPFFTTKPVGKGTGLGLSLAYNIITSHQGQIEVSSQPGRGSTFRIWLPIARPTEGEPVQPD